MANMEQLEALGAKIDEIEGPSPEKKAEQQAEQDQASAMEEGARQWGMIAFMLGNAVGMFVPEVKPIYSEEACMNWGRAMMPVAEKRGWNGPSALPELGLFIATAGLVIPTFMLVRAKVSAIKEGREGVEKAGLFGAVVAWWRSRKGAKEQAAAQAAQGATHGG